MAATQNNEGENRVFAIFKNRVKKPGLVLAIGTGLWKIMSAMSTVDFIFSIGQEKIAMIFEAFLSWGWLVFVAIGIVWAFGSKKSSAKRKGDWGMAMSVGIVAFLFGVLLGTQSSFPAPHIIQGWGTVIADKQCTATVDTSRLVGFKNKYHMVLICGVSDPKIDPQDDERIGVSTSFRITGQTMSIAGPLGKILEIRKDIPPMPEGTIAQFNIWHAIALIPNAKDPATIQMVSDVPKEGGLILTRPVGSVTNTLLLFDPRKTGGGLLGPGP
jgi:hypothetical protein